MNCFTYTDNKITEGCEILGKTQKTCQILLTIPRDWASSVLLSQIEGHERSDVLLHCVSALAPGDAEVSAFPKDAILVFCTDPIHITTWRNPCYEVFASADGCAFVVYPSASLIDERTSTILQNDAGLLAIKPTPSEISSSRASNSNDVVISI